ncbi:Membrane-anchored lipid-binding protein YSP2 like [Verticillium longisporum]|nr:Membrane-anchored lipid-binding protein YSP2 like [Verticillium longisporum]
MTRTYSYMKPLGGSIGPSKTKCIVSESIDHIDLEKAVNITCSTQTPDVPSGNAFIGPGQLHPGVDRQELAQRPHHERCQ